MTEDIIQFERTASGCSIQVRGEIDLSNSQQLRKTILGALRADPAVKVVLKEVTYIDSSGIAALVEGLQYANSQNKRFTLSDPSEHVRSILELARLDTVFEIEP